jgi:O-antigen ligase
LVAVFSAAWALSALASAADHFVIQVLVDCVIAVTQTVFTIALFLFFREARHAAATAAPTAPAA